MGQAAKSILEAPITSRAGMAQLQRALGKKLCNEEPMAAPTNKGIIDKVRHHWVDRRSSLCQKSG
jgi:hypothetical protein